MGSSVDHLGPAGDPGARELLHRLDLDVRIKLDGLLHGDYQGLVPGHGSEPGETRRYTPGDDVRRIDWNVTARMQRPYVRESIADRELETNVLIDLSPRLDFGTAMYEKRDLALAATAAVGLLTARLGNRVGAVLASPEGIETVPAKSGRAPLLALLHRVQNHPRLEGGVPDLEAGLARLASMTRHRGLTVMVSDFLAPIETWEPGLRRLTTRHEALAIEIIDPRELELPDVGVLSVVDPASGELREVSTRSAKLRNRYAEAAAQQRDDIATAMRRAGADHLVLNTGRDWLLDMAQFVALRRRRSEAAMGRPR
ncbi:MAG: DUF58 domain-containing protein [Acidimicrobiia bacterium]|nr:DUF58 domain-containing protein [Acidimicrobiia bacterium]